MLASTRATNLGKEPWALDNVFRIVAEAWQDREEFCDQPAPTLPVCLHPFDGILVKGCIPPATAQPASVPPSSVLFMGWPQKTGHYLGIPYEMERRGLMKRDADGSP